MAGRKSAMGTMARAASANQDAVQCEQRRPVSGLHRAGPLTVRASGKTLGGHEHGNMGSSVRIRHITIESCRSKLKLIYYATSVSQQRTLPKSYMQGENLIYA